LLNWDWGGFYCQYHSKTQGASSNVFVGNNLNVLLL
jgi:hypothetical protein